MKKPVRLLVYVSILALAWYLLSPAVTLNSHHIGSPVKTLLSQLNGAGLAALTIGLALVVTYLITSGWGLLILGGLAFCALVALGIYRPYLFPLLVPLAAIWTACAVARRKESADKNA